MVKRKEKSRKKKEKEKKEKMPISVAMMLTWSRVPAARQARVTSELIPDGLTDLKDYSVEDGKDAIKGFKSLPRQNDKFSLSALTTKQIVQITLWVKDQTRLGQAVEFENGTTQEQFVHEIEAAKQREKIRQERKKNTEALAT